MVPAVPEIGLFCCVPLYEILTVPLKDVLSVERPVKEIFADVTELFAGTNDTSSKYGLELR